MSDCNMGCQPDWHKDGCAIYDSPTAETIPVVKSPMRVALDIMDTIARDAGVSFDEPMNLPPSVLATIIPTPDMDERGKAEYMLRRMAAWAQLLVDSLPAKEPELIPYPNGHTHPAFVACRKKCPMNKESNDA